MRDEYPRAQKNFLMQMDAMLRRLSCLPVVAAVVTIIVAAMVIVAAMIVPVMILRTGFDNYLRVCRSADRPQPEKYNQPHQPKFNFHGNLSCFSLFQPDYVDSVTLDAVNSPLRCIEPGYETGYRFRLQSCCIKTTAERAGTATGLVAGFAIGYSGLALIKCCGPSIVTVT